MNETVIGDTGTSAAGSSERRGFWVLGLAGVVAVASIIGVTVGDLEREATGAVCLVLMLALMSLRVPIGAAMGLAGTLGLFVLAGGEVAWTTLAQLPFRTTASWSLSVLPMFILMGVLLWVAGVTTKLYEATQIWMGWLPGGLALTTNFAGAGLAAASGSTLGITYAVAQIATPEMLRAGYDRRLAVGSILMAGTGGQLIPPSILLVIYAGAAQTAVGPQLLAGVIPGVLLALAYATFIVVLSIVKPHMAPRPAKQGVSWRERFRSLPPLVPIPVLAAIVIGGLYFGVFTATEAGAFGALGAIGIAALFVGVSDTPRICMKAAKFTVSALASIMFLLVGAAILGRLMALSGLTRWFADGVAGMELSRLQFILLLTLIFVVAGMFVDQLTMILVMVPLLLPAATTLGIDPLWFGVFVVLLAEISVLTPPVGLLVFIVHRIVQIDAKKLGVDISLGDVFMSALWFLPMAFAVLILLALVPGLAEWLPYAAR